MCSIENGRADLMLNDNEIMLVIRDAKSLSLQVREAERSNKGAYRLRKHLKVAKSDSSFGAQR